MEERVNFVSDGQRLSGILHLPEGRAPEERRAAFAVLHRFGSNKDGGGGTAMAKMLAGLGYAALRFDFRGCGESEGERGRVICMEQVKDTRNALSFLATRAEIDLRRIGVVGQSFGAAVAVYAAGVDRRVAACISSGGWGDGLKKFRKQHASARAWLSPLPRNPVHGARADLSMRENHPRRFRRPRQPPAVCGRANGR